MKCKDTLARRIADSRVRCYGSRDSNFWIIGDTFGLENEVEAVGFKYNSGLHLYEARKNDMTERQMKVADKLRDLTKMYL